MMQDKVARCGCVDVRRMAVVTCSSCGSDDLMGEGETDDGRLKVRCGACGHSWVRGPASHAPEPETVGPRRPPSGEALADMLGIELETVHRGGTFDMRWPSGDVERYPDSWETSVRAGGRTFGIKHVRGARDAFGAPRCRTLTLVNGDVYVEGVGEDRHDETKAMLSVLKVPSGRRHVQEHRHVPKAYRDFQVVRFTHRISGDPPWSSLAVRLIDDDIAAWTAHALLRGRFIGWISW